MVKFTPQRQWIVAAVVVLALIAAWRLSLRPAAPPPAAPPPPSSPSGLERYFTWTVVHQNLDPIVLERESQLFASAVVVLRREPDFFDGWITIGGAKKAVGDFAGAAEIWEHAGQLRPNNSLSYGNLGDLYANFLRDYPRAVAAYRQAIKNSAGEEKNIFFYLNLFDLYRYRLQDPAPAFRLADEGMAANGYDVELPLRGARYAAAIGERAKALAYYQAALQRQPGNAELAAEYRRYRDGR